MINPSSKNLKRNQFLKINKNKINQQKAVFQSLKEAKVLKSKENKKINKKDKSLKEVKVKQNLKEENQLVIGKNLLKKKLKISKIKTQLTNRQIQEKEEDLNQ